MLFFLPSWVLLGQHAVGANIGKVEFQQGQESGIFS
jgi:hypothetical protein